MALYGDYKLEISCCAAVATVRALSSENYPLSVIDTGGNRYLKLLGNPFLTVTLTLLTRCFDYLTASVTVIAGT